MCRNSVENRINNNSHYNSNVPYIFMQLVAFLTRPLSDEKMIIGLDEIFVILRVSQWRLRVDLARVTEKPVVLFVYKGE